MNQPKSGDPCPDECGGVLRVYCTKRTLNGEFVLRFLSCNTCGAKPAGSKSIAPAELRTTSSTDIYGQLPEASEYARMHQIPDDIDDASVWLNGWQLAQYLGIEISDLMELQYGGGLPDPVHIRPLL